MSNYIPQILRLTWLDVEDPVAREWAGIAIKFIQESYPESSEILSNLIKNG
jgi:hypothetical protein